MSNIYNLFKFLEKKRGTETPRLVKYVHAPEELTGDDLNVEGDLDLQNTKITSLPDGLKVGGDLDLHNIPIASLPDNLSIGKDLNLSFSAITSLPDNLSVGGDLFINPTPLARKYDEEQIRKIIEDKGGYVKGGIYV